MLGIAVVRITYQPTIRCIVFFN